MKLNQGLIFSYGGLICGIGCIGFAIGILATKEITIMRTCVSCFLILLGLTFFSTKTLIIEKENNVLIEKYVVLGFKILVQKTLTDFCFITIIGQLYSLRSRSRATLELDNQRIDYKYDLFLINEFHHNKYKIKTFSKLEYAEKCAKEISSLLSYDIVKFNPVRTRRK